MKLCIQNDSKYTEFLAYRENDTENRIINRE